MKEEVHDISDTIPKIRQILIDYFSEFERMDLSDFGEILLYNDIDYQQYDVELIEFVEYISDEIDDICNIIWNPQDEEDESPTVYFLKVAETNSHNYLSPENEYSELEKFANIGSWNYVLDNLSMITGDKYQDHTSLKSALNQAFEFCKENNQIIITDSDEYGKIAEFNTGLKSRDTNEDIYACFQENSNPYTQKWFLRFYKWGANKTGEYRSHLDKFAYIKWDRLFDSLSKIVESDVWNEEKLKKQLLSFFNKSIKEKTIVYYKENNEEKVKFYTGLQNHRTGADIYACFESNRVPGKQPWYFYRFSSERSNALDQFAYMGLPGDTLSNLFIFNNYAITDFNKLQNILIKAFEKHKKNDTIEYYRDNEWARFDTGLKNDKIGENIYACFKLNRIPGKEPWYFKFFECGTRKIKSLDPTPLEIFAYMGFWGEVLTTLSELIETGERKYSLPELKAYLETRFEKCKNEHLIIYSKHEEYAEFDTGLKHIIRDGSDEKSEDIIACFSRNDYVGKQEWIFRAFRCGKQSNILKMHIENVKSINNLSIDLPLKKGVYAITGINASGKSTIVSCASTIFLNINPDLKYQYSASKNIAYSLGQSHKSSKIQFTWNGTSVNWIYNPNNKKWYRNFKGTLHPAIKGFYEGSVLYGNRFRDVTPDAANKYEDIGESELITADNFVKENLGKILLDDPTYYSELYRLKDDLLEDNENIVTYFYKKGGDLIRPAHMSTGEYLLVSILHSLNLRIKTRQDRGEIDSPCIMFLDEVELALHSSALMRLIQISKKIADENNMAIYFSTHSLEIIREISPENLFNVERDPINKTEIYIENPCYPAFATKSLYCECEYDRIIFVEDDLAEKIVKTLLDRNLELKRHKLIHIVKCGGWTHVLQLANDIGKSSFVNNFEKIIVILDGDVESKDVIDKIRSNNLDYKLQWKTLPIKSLEKYLKAKLFDSFDNEFYKLLSNDALFNQKSDVLLSEIQNYKKWVENGHEDHEKHNNGKYLFDLLVERAVKELSQSTYISLDKKSERTRIQKTYDGYVREKLVDFVVNYMQTSEEESKKLDVLLEFLSKKL